MYTINHTDLIGHVHSHLDNVGKVMLPDLSCEGAGTPDYSWRLLGMSSVCVHVCVRLRAYVCVGVCMDIRPVHATHSMLGNRKRLMFVLNGRLVK